MIWKGGRGAPGPTGRASGGPGRQRAAWGAAALLIAASAAAAGWRAHCSAASAPAPPAHKPMRASKERPRSGAAGRQPQAASVSWPARDVSFPQSALSPSHDRRGQCPAAQQKKIKLPFARVCCPSRFAPAAADDPRAIRRLRQQVRCWRGSASVRESRTLPWADRGYLLPRCSPSRTETSLPHGVTARQSARR